MMSDKIEEIRERFTNGAPWTRTTLQDDIATLLAEDARHRAENEKLRAENERLIRLNKLLERNEREFLAAIGLVTTTVSNMEIDIENPVGMAQRVVAEFKKLRAEIEALHEAMRRGEGDRFVVERRTTGPDTPVTFIREGKP